MNVVINQCKVVTEIFNFLIYNNIPFFLKMYNIGIEYKDYIKREFYIKYFYKFLIKFPKISKSLNFKPPHSINYIVENNFLISLREYEIF